MAVERCAPSDMDGITDSCGISHDSLTETSTSESSDGNSSGGRKGRIRIRRKKLVLKPKKSRFIVPPLYEPIIYRGVKRHRTFAVFPQFFSLEEIQRIHNFCTHESVRQIMDRTKSLTYVHVAYRVEMQARRLAPDIYDKLAHVVQWTDSQVWKKLPERVFPELEYIVYDRELQGGRPGYIEEHVDNKSAVTFVTLLSHPSEFDGGINYFARAEKHGVPRPVALQQGDVVIFRGERMLHWISPVPHGRRVILQGEMSRV